MKNIQAEINPLTKKKMKRTRLWLILFLTVPILSLIVITTIWIFNKYQASKQTLNDINKSPHAVLDCSGYEPDCVTRQIEYNITNCETWYPGKEEGQPVCEKTKVGLEDITFISDPANYIPVPFTSEDFTAEVMNISLNKPRDLEFLPDGSILIAQREGQITHYINGKSKLIYESSSLYAPPKSGFLGLTGLAIDPDFTTNHYVYIYYTYELDRNHPTFTNYEQEGERRVLNRISRLTFSSDQLNKEKILLNNIPGNSWHSGGRLEFGPDGKLYATTGEAGEKTLAQDITFLGGKILRLNPDGTAPKDNPFPGSYVYSLGHRNPQGLAWHPQTGDLYVSEHGQWRYDEINRIIPGKNYGWGSYECEDKIDWNPYAPELQTETMIEPLVCTKTWTLAPSGMEYITDSNSPWYTNLFVSSLRGKHLHRYQFENNRILIDEIFFTPAKSIDKKDITKISRRIRDVEYFQGSLYVLGDNRGLAIITPTSQK